MKRLELYRPVKPWIMAQNFGESKACIYPDKKIVLKVNGVCPQGSISLYESVGLKAHNGIDIAAYSWQPVYASTDGIVSDISTDPELGLGIEMITQDKWEFVGGQYYAQIRYWHLAGLNVQEGDFIRIGQLIGWADNTGYSNGDHLHFDLKPVFKNDKDDWHNVFQNNGFFGAVNPDPYIMSQYAYDINSALEKMKYQLIQLMNWLQDILSKRSISSLNNKTSSKKYL